MHGTMRSSEFTILMAMLMSVVAISIDALLPALGLIGEQMQVQDANHVQLVIGGIFGGMGLGQLVAGPISDAVGRKPVLYVGILIYLAGSVLCYAASDFSTLLIGRFIQGLGVSAPYVTAISVVRDKYSGRDMARVMSLVMMIFILVPAVAPSIGIGIMHLSGWRAIFMLYIGYSVLVGLWVFLRLEETLPKAHRVPLQWQAFRHGLRMVFSNRTTFLYMLCAGLSFAPFIAYIGASRQIFQQQFGVGEDFAYYFGALALVLGAASLLNARIVARFGMRPICVHSAGAIVVASLLFFGLHLVVSTVTLPMFLAYACVIFFSFGLMFGNLNSIAMEPMGDIAGMAAALSGFVASIIQLSLGTLIGQLYDGTLRPIAAGFVLMCGLAWALMAAEQRYHHRQRQHTPD